MLSITLKMLKMIHTAALCGPTCKVLSLMGVLDLLYKYLALNHLTTPFLYIYYSCDSFKMQVIGRGVFNRRAALEWIREHADPQVN